MTSSTIAPSRPRLRLVAWAVLASLLSVLPLGAIADAEDQASQGSERSESRTFRFTAEGGKEVVVTPKQKARREERRARRKARHAAEAEARRKAAESKPAGSDAH